MSGFLFVMQDKSRDVRLSKALSYFLRHGPKSGGPQLMNGNLYHLRSEGGILFSSVCVFVWMSVNTLTPESLEISAQNFQCIILWLKWWTS